MATACAKLDMSPVCLNILGVRAGDANQRQYTLTADGKPWDLTGATLTAQARAAAVDPATALTADITVTDPAGGVFILAWPGDDVSELLAGADHWSGVWDLEMHTDGEPLPTTLLAGSLQCVADVTR